MILGSFSRIFVFASLVAYRLKGTDFILYGAADCIVLLKHKIKFKKKKRAVRRKEEFYVAL